MADGLATRLSRMDRGAGFNKAAKGPNSLLTFLAGPHAGRIAQCWPQPHDRFFALPAARRHAAVILLARADASWNELGRDIRRLSDGEIARAVERHKDVEIARRLTDGDTPPAGLMKAMARMGETQWALDDYERFLDLFQDPGANAVLRHIADITPHRLHLLGALPPALRDAKIVACVPDEWAARDLGLALGLAVKLHGERAKLRLVRRWSRASDSVKLLTMAAEDLEPARFSRPAPVPELPETFEPVVTRKRLGEVALAFRNCLRDFAHDLAVGRMTVFVWRGTPEVVLALRWDSAGWRLAEAEIAGNEEVPRERLEILVQCLTARGIRTGPGLSTLARRLMAHTHGNAERVGTAFRDQLELGELWD